MKEMIVEGYEIKPGANLYGASLVKAEAVQLAMFKVNDQTLKVTIDALK